MNKNSRVEVIVLVPEAAAVDEDDEPKAKILESLRQSLQDVKAGKTRPVSELWNSSVR